MLDWIDREARKPELLLHLLRREDLPDADVPNTSARIFRSRIVIAYFHSQSGLWQRCSTVVTVTSEGDGQIIERRYDADGHDIGQNRMASEMINRLRATLF